MVTNLNNGYDGSTAAYNMEYLNYLVRTVTDNAKCTRGITRGIAMAKAAFNVKQARLTSKLELHVRKKPVKCCIWSIGLCGAETGILRKVGMMHLKGFEMWCCRRGRSVGPIE